MTDVVEPKKLSLNPNLSLWDNMKEWLPICSIARIIWCLLNRGWKYSDIAHVMGCNKHTIESYLRRHRKVCVDPSLKVMGCIDCEKYMKILKLFGVDVQKIESESWFWGGEQEDG